MLPIQTARRALYDALKILSDRSAVTPDPGEQIAITDSMAQINAILKDLQPEDLLAAATAVVESASALQSAIAAAQYGPFSGYLGDLERIWNALTDAQADMHAVESLARTSADLPESLTDELEATIQPNLETLAAPSKATDFPTLRDEYTKWFSLCDVEDGKQNNVDYYIKMLHRGKDIYTRAVQGLGIPWYVVGILHGMESGFNFNSHLHNGDPLTGRTVHVPAGRPKSGSPPFAWVDSAQDALRYDGLDTVTDWSTAHLLYLFERFNGMGYRKLGVPSPYLWGHSNLYKKGKFVRDHVFDPNAVSKQTGAGLILKQLKV